MTSDGAEPTGRLRPVLVELAVVLVPAAAVALGFAPFSWSLVAALVACAALPLRRLWAPLGLLACLWGLAGGLGWPPALVALFTLGRRSGSVRAVAPWLVLPIAASVVPVLVTSPQAWPNVVLMFAIVTLYVVAPTALGLLVCTRERLTESLRQLERAREHAVAASQDAARAQERARIGREIHDAVGHHATLIAVSAAALEASAPDEATRSAAQQLRLLAKRALAEMRTTLGLVDGAGPVAGLTEITALIEGSRAAGVEVDLAESGDRVEVAPSTGRAVYRVVQEALTNAARHAPDTRVSVGLTWRPRELEVAVRNTAPSLPRPRRAEALGSGTGLPGLTERVTALGGELVAGPDPDGGFAVIAKFGLCYSAVPTKVALAGATEDGGGSGRPQPTLEWMRSPGDR